ncbi:hypothetical protein [Actibacterium sp. 188UL27-1]|uniref:hypothetical protein n=1 Tax=Actibacterium sp. 188UL27-1 TaxID=2786961 RepID=UPI00195AA06C|nr:hypothetical protein [Actibacterium sp. 188UL27-1]MBM7068373.1 hypothetical protein [Actibacterium sp. 188UL27-1]
MLLFRSIPLSFQLLLPLLLIYPLLLVVMVLIWALCAFVGGLVAVVSPGLGAMIAALPMGIGYMLPLMVGLRLALQARGLKIETGYGPLIWGALGYGFLEGIFLVAMTTMVGFMTQTSLPTIIGFFHAISSLSIPSWVYAPLIFYTVFGSFLAFCLFRAALLPSLASASIGRDPDGQAHTPLRGFGTRLSVMFGVVVLSWVTMVLTAPVIFWGLDALQAVLPEDIDEGWGGLFPWYQLLALALLMLWPTAMQAAAGALWYQESRAAGPIPMPGLQRSLSEDQPTDLRALRKSRMK